MPVATVTKQTQTNLTPCRELSTKGTLIPISTWKKVFCHIFVLFSYSVTASTFRDIVDPSTGDLVLGYLLIVYSPLNSLMTQTHFFKKKKVAEKTYKSVSFSRSLFSLRFTSYTMLLTPAVLGSLTAVEKHASLKNAANSFGRRPLIGQRALPPFDLLRGGGG